MAEIAVLPGESSRDNLRIAEAALGFNAGHLRIGFLRDEEAREILLVLSAARRDREGLKA